MTDAPNVVGLDISLTATGIASSRGWADTVGAKSVTTLPILERVKAVDELHRRIMAVVGTPVLAVVEVPAFSRSGGGALERSALWWQVLRSLTARCGAVALVHNNTRMRYATGKGSATKAAIVDAVARRFPMFETGGDDNIADAVVLAAMGADWLGHPIGQVPKTHRTALDAVDWPSHLNEPTTTTAGSRP